jgi:TonB family protein
VLIILFLVYELIKTNLSFVGRRITLLMIPLLSILSGIINFYFFTSSNTYQVSFKTIQLDIVNINTDQITNNPTINFNYINILTDIFYTGAILSILFSTYKICVIIYFIISNKNNNQNGYHLIETRNKQSFSFFNYIHLNTNLNEDEKKIVLEHELIHIKKKHSFDLIFTEVIQTFFWFNPLYLFLKKELIVVHEYEVDEIMYAKHGDNYIINLLNHTLGLNTSQLILTSQFYNKVSLAKRTKNMKNKVKIMKPLLISIPVMSLFLATVSFTNNSKNKKTHLSQINNEIVQDSVYTTAEIDPEFPGGEVAMTQFIVDNFVYPKKAKEDKITGTVYSKFIVSKTGKIKDVSVIKGLSPEIDAECIRVISIMPKWKPGKNGGKKVSVEYIVPIRLYLDDNKN